MSDSGEYYRITCRFCDTILTVGQDQAGQDIKCPDCFSILTAGPAPAKTKSKSIGRGGRSWKGDEKPTELGLSKSMQLPADSDSSDELKLSETFERPAISPLFGLDASEQDLLAPRKRRPLDDDLESDSESHSESGTEETPQPSSRPKRSLSSPATETANSSTSQSHQDTGLDVDLPLPVEEVLSLDAIGKLDPTSEPEAGTSTSKSDRPAGMAGGKQRTKKQAKIKSKAPAEVQASRPDFKFANLFMATVGMLTDMKVLAASGVAVLVMLVGGFSSESIFPVGSNIEELTMTASMYKYFASFLFGNLPYYIGLLGLWTVAGIVFQHAAQGHVKVQNWVKAGQSELWSSFLLFGFSFFIAGLPGAILQLMIIPLRMLVAPLFLISAWFNFSPWQIVSTDWYQSVQEDKSQWITVYSCFGGLAFAGLLTGGVFMARASSELVAVDLILTFIGIVANAVITLVFAAIAGWHTGAVIESLDPER